MFWILRRTGAVNFFNSLNNNCNASKGTNNDSGSSNSNNNSNHSNGNSSNIYTSQKKYVKRPPRKAYGRLNAESDEVTTPIKQKMKDIDKLEMITTASSSTTVNDNSNTLNVFNYNNNSKRSNRIINNMIQLNDSDNNMNCSLCGITTSPSPSPSPSSPSSSRTIQTMESCTIHGCQGNCNEIDGNDNSHHHLSPPHNNDDDNDNGPLCRPINDVAGKAIKSSSSASSSSMYCHNNSNNNNKNYKGVNQITINRLQAMAISEDEEDYDESLTCNVCDRSFHCQRQLASHQQKKRHFGCSACDNLFPTLMSLEHHKEEFEHWSDNELHERLCCARSTDYFTDTDSFSSEAESEDLERLL